MSRGQTYMIRLLDDSQIFTSFLYSEFNDQSSDGIICTQQRYHTMLMKDTMKPSIKLREDFCITRSSNSFGNHHHTEGYIHVYKEVKGDTKHLNNPMGKNWANAGLTNQKKKKQENKTELPRVMSDV
uniref:Uncharacterized protein n=1 Tax=Trypanosoma vivax (strain Y486) TaxID=1055687 RepID=G0TV99_TRYVY|nr:hypothetical protein TVY486_0500740 [Trypanosoma vivax Y486]